MTLGGGTYRAPVVTERDDGAFRPTGLMEKASKVIEESPGLGREDVLWLVGGKRKYTGAALGLLVAEQYVRTEQDGRAETALLSRPYREPRMPITATRTPYPRRTQTYPVRGRRAVTAYPDRVPVLRTGPRGTSSHPGWVRH